MEDSEKNRLFEPLLAAISFDLRREDLTSVRDPFSTFNLATSIHSVRCRAIVRIIEETTKDGLEKALSRVENL